MIELDHIHGAGRILKPLDRVIVGGEESIFIRQRTAKMMQELAEIGACLRFARIRPK